MMKRYLGLLLVIILVSSCINETQKFKLNTLDLEKLQFDFKSESFFAENAMNKQYFIGKYEYTIKGGQKGYEYIHDRSSSADKLAKFYSLNFDKIGALTTLSDELMLFYAYTKNADSLVYRGLIEKLTEKYGIPVHNPNPQNIWPDGIRMTWSNKNKVIQIYPRTVYSHFHQENRFWITLFIANPKYEKKLRGSLNTGNWNCFD
ncbi:MAG: hypothetical protein JKY08_07310 [Flavobacteriaceae bacterium]|nr:hypothetical protein [Flavobacteriaceae bacterium]